MIIPPTIFAVIFALAAMGTADADELRPMEGRQIALGEVSGTVYYIVERSGFRVVATLAQGEAGTPLRIEAILAPGQSVLLSLPHAVGVAPDVVEIRRHDDRILVQAVPITN
jgi:hypothetical protein